LVNLTPIFFVAPHTRTRQLKPNGTNLSRIF